MSISFIAYVLLVSNAQPADVPAPSAEPAAASSATPAGTEQAAVGDTRAGPGPWTAIPTDLPESDDVSPPVPEPDLLDQLLAALDARDAEARQRALAPLAAGGGERVVQALVYIAANDDDLAVATAAVESLAGVNSPLAAAGLGWLAVSDQPEEVWRRALALLGDMQAPHAAEALFSITSNREAAASVRRGARDTLELRYPKLVQQRGVPEVAGSPILPMFGGALFGGYTLGAVGAFAKADAGPTIGVLGGALSGGAAGFLIGRNFSTERSYYYLSAMGWGLYSGVLGTLVADESPTGKVVLAMGVAGELAGFGAGWLLEEKLRLDAGGVWLANVNGVAAAALTMGALGLSNQEADPRLPPALLLGAALSAAAGSALLAPHTRFSIGDRLLSGLGAIEGAWLGGFVGSIHEPPGGDTYVPGATMLGGGLGLFFAEALSQHADLSAGDVTNMALLSAYGKALGAGTALLARAERDAVVYSQLATGIVAVAAAGAAGTDLDYARGDFVLVPVATALGLAHGLSVGLYLEEQERIGTRRLQGLALTTTAAAGLGAVAATQLFDPDPLAAGMGSLGAVWGAWLVGWTSSLSNTMKPGHMLLVTTIGADVALLATSVLVSPAFDVDPLVIAGATLGAVGASGVASLTAALITEDSDAIKITNVIGTAAGLIAGGLVTYAIIDPEEQAAPAAAGAGGELSLPPFAIMPQPHINGLGQIDGAVLSATFLTD